MILNMVSEPWKSSLKIWFKLLLEKISISNNKFLFPFLFHSWENFNSLFYILHYIKRETFWFMEVVVFFIIAIFEDQVYQRNFNGFLCQFHDYRFLCWLVKSHLGTHMMFMLCIWSTVKFLILWCIIDLVLKHTQWVIFKWCKI